MSHALHAAKWVVYVARLALYAAYGCLQFLSKPGSRLIVPVLALAAAYAYWSPLDAVIERTVLHADWRHMPEPATLYTVAALGPLLAICVCVTLFPVVANGLLLFMARLAVLVALLVAGAYLYRAELAAALVQYAPELEWQLKPLQATVADAIAVLALLLATCVYVTLSRLLVLLLGAFPPVVRPLRPLRALRVRNRRIRPVVVRMAVPRLPGRSRVIPEETEIKPVQAAASLPERG